MRRKREEREELDDEKNSQAGEEELSEKELKKKKQRESVEKRKNIKRKDKVARWGGIILLGLFMFIGFLLWVAGEMKSESPTIPSATERSGQRNIAPFETQSGSVIVK